MKKSSDRKLPISKQLSPSISLNRSVELKVIAGAQLSVWHDTAGPVVEQLWTTEEHIPADFQAFMARQTLCGLDTKIVAEETRFNIYPEQGFMVPSIIFNSRYHDKITKFALSVFLDLSKLSTYQHIHDIVTDRMSMLAAIILRNYSQNIFDQTTFTEQLIDVCENIESIFLSSYPHADISSTYFMELKVADTDFFIRAITSTLQTNGSAIVIGSQERLIEKWMDTLSLFLTPNERSISSRQLRQKIVPDLMIQGLHHVSLKQIEEKVKSVIAFKDQSMYIQKMVNEVFSLPLDLREIYLIHFMRLMLRKASFVVAHSQSTDCLGINYAKKLKSELNLPSESDVYLLFGISEKLQLNLFMSAIKLEQMEKVFAFFADGF
eukprot:gene10791-12574_t